MIWKIYIIIKNSWGFNIKFIDLNKQYLKIKNKVNNDILNTLQEGNFILGDNVSKLEMDLSNYVGVKECITCASGTDALLIPLMARNIKRGDAIFTTNFSFFATTEVISLVGATPVFADVDRSTWTLDPESFKNSITKNTKALIL